MLINHQTKNNCINFRWKCISGDNPSLFETNSPIRQKIPIDVSSNALQRAPKDSGFAASGRLSRTLGESTFTDKAQKHRMNDGPYSNNTESQRCLICALANELRTNSPWLRVNSRGKIGSDPSATEGSSIFHQTHDKQIQGLVWMANEWGCFATDRHRCQRVTKVQKSAMVS